MNDQYKNGLHKLGRRTITFLIILIHLGFSSIYILSILFATDLYTLFLIMFGNFILVDMYSIYRYCILSKYEDMNKEIHPSLSRYLCSLLGSKEECSINTNYEKIYVYGGVFLAFVKFLYLAIQKESIGKYI